MNAKDHKKAKEILDKVRIPNEEYGGYDIAYNDAIDAMEQFAQFKQAEDPAKSVDVNFLLVNALRHLDNEQIKSLADSLYERLPAKSVTDEDIEVWAYEEYEQAKKRGGDDYADAYHEGIIEGTKAILNGQIPKK